MSTLEKATELLQKLPENKLEAVYVYMCFVDTQMETDDSADKFKSGMTSAFGISSEYAGPGLIPLEKDAFANAASEKHADSY